MPKYITVKQLHETGLYPCSYEFLQKLFKNRQDNGLKKCSSKIGSKYFVNQDLFNEWIENHENIKEDV